MITTAITQRGLRLDDLKIYTIGGIIDYIITWNNIMHPMHEGDIIREATPEDIRRFKNS